LGDIDFVVTWVNGEDKQWQNKMQKYKRDEMTTGSLNTASRYRNFHLFKYWFRAVEKYAPWVHKVFLITDNQCPEWVNKNNAKLEVINHPDYIDSNVLPTFNSNVIELNIFKIKGLSEHFVLFNDDMFLNAPVKESDFFVKGMPKDIYAESPIVSTDGSIAHTLVNNIRIINRVFSKREFYRRNYSKVFNPKIGNKIFRTIALFPSSNFTGMWNSHLPVPYLKETFKQVWQYMPDELENMMRNRFRTPSDYSHWLMRYWQLASGDFCVQKRNFGKVYDIGMTPQNVLEREILGEHHQLLCLNDTDNVKDAGEIASYLQCYFEMSLPKASMFEI